MSSSKHHFVMEEDFRKIKVPADGNFSLFWAVTMAYLLPVRNNQNFFTERFEKLFGVESEVKDVQRLILTYPSRDIYKDLNLIQLVTRVFRNRVIDEALKRDVDNSVSWVGEIEAMKSLLRCQINIFDGQTNQHPLDQNKCSIIFLFLNENNFEFCLVTPRVIIELLKNLNYKLALSLVTIGIEGVNDEDDLGWSLLHYATTTDNYQRIIERLVDQGADLRARNRNHQSALDLARFLKQEKSIEALTNYLGTQQAKAEAIVPQGTGDMEILVKQFCSGTANAMENSNNKIIDSNSNERDFNLAIINNNVEIVRKLINNGLDVNQKMILEDKSENYPLHVATQKGNLEVIKIVILEGKAKLDIKDGNGATPLHAAVQHGFSDIIDYLIYVGAGVNSVDASGMTPLHHSVLRAQWKAVQSLVEREADVNVLNDNGETPLSMVISKGNWEMVRYLIENGASLIGLSEEIKRDIYRKFIENLEKDDQLHRAIALGNVELLQRLIQSRSIENEALFEVYNQFRLLNLKLNSEISCFLENKLMDDRYYSDNKVSEEKVQENIDTDNFNLKKRVQLIINCVDKLLDGFSVNEEVNDVFLFMLKFIIRNLQALKQSKKIAKLLPWEEMQFCLINFLMSYLEPLKFDVCVNLILHKRKILNYLFTFKTELSKLDLEQLNFSENSSQFKELRKDFQRLKDLRSLHRIDWYLRVACSVYLKENPEVGKLAIERALQVSGECLKSTDKSPNLSEKTQEQILNFSPINTTKTVTNLRDVLSHVSALVIKIHKIENNRNNVTYFEQIQNDLRHIKPGISHLLYSKNIEIVNRFLKNIRKCETIEQVRDMVSGIQRFDRLEVPVPVDGDDSYRVVEKLAEYVEEFKKSEVNQKITEFKQMNLNDCDILIDKIQSRNRNIRETHAQLLKEINDFIQMIKNGDYSLEIIREKTRLIIEKDLDQNCFNQDLSRLVSLIEDNGFRMKPVKVNDQISNLMQYNNVMMGNTKAIDRFQVGLDESNNANENAFRVLNQLEQNYLTILRTIEDKDVKNAYKTEYKNRKDIHRAKNTLIEFYEQLPIVTLDFEEFTKLIEKIDFQFSTRKNNKEMSSTSSLYAQNEQKICKKIIHLVKQKTKDPVGQLLTIVAKNREQTDFSHNILAHFKTYKSLENFDLAPGLVQPTDSYIRKYFVDKLRVLESICDLRKSDSELLQSLKTNEELRLALEMLTLTLMEIFENFSYLESNKLYLDEAYPVLMGKNLRNYLAHGDLTIEAMSIDALKSIIYHLKEIQKNCSKAELIVHIGEKKIGRIIHENLDEIEARFIQELQLLKHREKLIKSVKEIQALDLKSFIFSELDLKYRDVSDRTLLYFASRTDNLDLFKILLNNDLNIYYRDKFQHSILYHLVKNNNIKILMFLKDNCSLDPNVIITKGKSLLHLSAEFGHPELSNWLLSLDVRKDELDNNNFTPLMLAIEHKHSDIARVLWKARASIEVNQLTRIGNRNNISMYQTLVNCVTNEKMSSKKIDEALVKADDLMANSLRFFNIDNCKNEDEKTAFIDRLCAGELEHIVLDEGLKIVLRRLDFLSNISKQTADDEFKNIFKNIAHRHLQLACLVGSVNNVKILIENYIDINAAMNLGETALNMAAGLGHQKLVEFLLDNQADVTILSANGDSVLHKAAYQDNINIVKMLIERGADIHARNKDEETPLHKASKKGHCEVIEVLLSACASVNCVTLDGNSALHSAVFSNSPKTLEVLLSHGADVNAVDKAGQSLLQLVTFNGDIKMLKVLLNYSVNINVMDKRNNTPLSSAIFAKKEKVVELLLDNGADVNLYRIRQPSPLHVASQVGHLKILKLLLDKNANFTMDMAGHTPLHIAVFYSHVEIVEALLLKYQNTNVKDIDKTPLHYAAIWGFSKIVDVLLKHRVNVDSTDISKNSALHYAAIGGHYKIVEKLLLKNAKIDIRNALGSTALHHAASKGDKNIIELLLKSNKEMINVANNEGIMPLHLAIQRAHFDSVKLLLDNGAEVNARENTSNLSPLHVAVEHGNCKILELLLDYGAEIDAGDKNNFTGLSFAVAKGDKNMVRVLLRRGAKVNEKEEPPFFTLNAAVDRGHDDILSLLIKNGADVNVYFRGVTSLHIAAIYGHKIAAQILIKNGAKIEALDGKKQTPAHRAAINGHHELIKVLHKHKANLNAKNIDNFTPIHFAVENNHKQCVMYLFMFGADVSEITAARYKGLDTNEAIVRMVVSEDEENTNAISAVADNGVTSSLLPSAMPNDWSDHLKNLLLKSVDIEAAFKAGFTPLHLAVQSGHVAFVKMMLNFNPDLNAKNEQGASPLHVAVCSGHLEISEMLIRHGADVFGRNNHDSVLHKAVRNIKILKLVLAEMRNQSDGDAGGLRSAVNDPDTEGDTPLMWAVEQGNLDGAQVLLGWNEIDVNRQNLKGWTVLHWAVHVGHLEILQLLVEKKVDVTIRNNNGETAYDVAAANYNSTEDSNFEVIAALLLSLCDNL